MPNILDGVAAGDVYELSLSNGDRDVVGVTDTGTDASGDDWITGYVATVEPIRSIDDDVVFVPKARSRLRISGKKVTFLLRHIVKARHFGGIDGFGEYDLSDELPDAVRDKAKRRIDG